MWRPRTDSHHLALIRPICERQLHAEMGHLCQEEAAMALLQKGVATVTQWMPKVLSPRAHAIADYATVGTAALFSILFWNRNRNAAVAALLSAAAEAGVSLITDYPGG